VSSSSPLPAGLPIDAAQWEQTPLGVRQLVLRLQEVIQRQHTTIQQLEARIKTLEARLVALEARLQQCSRNSDRPPSSDPPYEKRTARADTLGRPGAKPGHAGHRPALWPPAEVLAVKPKACPCGQREFPETLPYYTHQVLELPEIQMHVTHVVLHEACCPQCGRLLKAPVPEAH
jgi:transposase